MTNGNRITEQQTPEQALQLLDRVLQQVSGTRADHIAIQQALSTLAKAIQPAEQPEPAAAE